MKKIILALLMASAAWGYGEGVVYWAPHACDTGKNVAAKHGGHTGGESAMFAAMNLEGNATSTLILPDLSITTLRMDKNTILLPKPPMGGYYALVLNQYTPTQINTAIRYLSLQGRPAKISPTKLTARSKADLEIVPDPLHREHDRYTASKEYRFLVMFKGVPLSNASVFLQTHNRTFRTFKSDAKGVVEITLPNDFTEVRIGRGENKPSEFLLQTRHNDGAFFYQSSLSMPYSINPNDYWQSQIWGAAAIVIGFLGGMILYRQMKKGIHHG